MVVVRYRWLGLDYSAATSYPLGLIGGGWNSRCILGLKIRNRFFLMKGEMRSLMFLYTIYVRSFGPFFGLISKI